MHKNTTSPLSAPAVVGVAYRANNSWYPRAEPLCAPLIPVSVKAGVFQIGQSVSVLDVVSTISAH